MPTIQLHYDGWLALPADARQHLHLVTGDRLDIELVEAGLLLRLAKQAKEAVTLGPMSATAPTAAVPAVAMRGSGQPRKIVTPDLTVPRLKVGGRRKSKPASTA